jgi:DNA-binding SARP family transcriptional activator
MHAHLAEGNMAEAVRQYDVFAQALRENLGITPTDSLRALVAPCR